MAHQEFAHKIRIGSIGTKFSKLSLILGLFLILLSVSQDIWAQNQGGSTSSERKETDNKTDQNLKSIAHVNPSTLAMEMSVPLMSYPGRNGNSLPVGFSYSSKLWRMESAFTWWYWQFYQPKYVTDIYARYAERSAAGWTSSLVPPRIDESVQIYDESGNHYSESILDVPGLNASWENVLSGFGNNTAMPCGTHCSRWDPVCPSGDPYCEAHEPTFHCGSYELDWCDTGDNGPILPGGPPSSPTPLYYVKRLQVSLSDGSTHEFRESDNSIQCGTTQTGCVMDLDGTYLAVDGSAMKLIRDEDTNSNTPLYTLYMPNGGRYTFPDTAQNGGEGIYAENYFDGDGNKLKFASSTILGETTNKWTDTLGREIKDPMPRNWTTQSQSPGPKEVDLPGLNGNDQEYEMVWAHLKQPGCEAEMNPSCEGVTGGKGGALEDQRQKLFYETRYFCRGNATQDLLTNPGDLDDPDNEVLFPVKDEGIRPCNGFNILYDERGTPIVDENSPYPTRFNPVVLSEIILPNGKQYTFQYNRFGEISRIIYPTGSYETFTYAKIAPLNGAASVSYDQTNRGVVKREVYDAGDNLIQTWEYSVAFTGFPNNISYKVTTKAPKQNDPAMTYVKSERFLNIGFLGEASFGFNDPRAGTPKEERTYDENNVLRSRTLTEWIYKGSENGPKRDVRASRSVSVAFESGQALASLSETEYDENGSTDAEYFSHLNVTRTKGYHFAAIATSTGENGTLSQIAGYFNANLLVSVSETDYQYNSNYKARGIPSLPIESRVLNPANTSEIVAKTQTLYDETAYFETTNTALTGDAASTWVNPNTTYRGKPTTTKLWNKDTNSWIHTHTTFDRYGNVRKVYEASESESHANEDRFVETFYDDLGNYSCNGQTCPQTSAFPTRVVAPAPDPSGTHGTDEESTGETTYDFTTGLVLKVKNDFDQETETKYEDALLRPTKVLGVGSYVIPITETIYDDNALTVKVRKQIDATNWDEATTFTDSLGRAYKTQTKDSQGDVFVETKYDVFGKVTAVSNPYRSGDSVLWSKTSYDALGRAIQSYAPAAYSSTGDSLGSTEYAISTESGFIASTVTTTDASGRKSRSFTNTLGQLTRVDESSSTNTLEALPQATPSPNPSPSPTPPPGDGPGCYGNAAPGCLTNGANTYPMKSTYYFYNAQGKMTRVQQGEQNRYFLYDSLARLIRIRQPEQEVNSSLNTTASVNGNTQWTAGFTYDVFGNVKRATDANGVNIINEYDKVNRVFKRCYSDPNVNTSATNCDGISSQLSDDTPTTDYKYDGLGVSGASEFSKGKLTYVNNTISQTRYLTFDNLGRLTSSEQKTPVGDETMSSAPTRISYYEYNLSGALTKETYPSGRVVQNEFESDGDLRRIFGKANANAIEKTYANSFSYTPDGRIEKLKLGSGLWESAKFNTRLQVTELALGIGVNDASRWKLNYEYGELNTDGTVNTTKNTGTIAKQTSSFSGLANPFVQTFKYDSLYRLIEARETAGAGQNAPQTWKQLFAYDRFGNRTEHDKFTGTTQITLDNVTHPTIDPATNRFVLNQGYEYDKNGNIIKDKDDSSNVRDFTLNGENKQATVKVNGATIGTYFYDGEGKRVKKKVFDSVGNPTEETVFVYSGGKLIAEYSTVTPPQTPTTSYTMTDQLGSPRVITNSVGEVVSRRDFMPFGEELFANANLYRSPDHKYSTIDQDSVRQRFTGYQKDSETKLDFAEARMYQNLHGRFTAVDPLLASGKSANPQTFNRYVYVLNNPLAHTDPTGLQTGDWYFPVDENGEAISGANYAYIQRGASTAGYKPVTETNRAGQLIGLVKDLKEGWIGRFNPNGPMSKTGLALRLLIPMVALEGISQYELEGWEPIKSDEYEDTFIEHPSDGYAKGSQEVGLELFLAFEGGRGIFRGSIGKFALESKIAEETAERSVIVTEQGLNKVKAHLAQFGEDPGNAGMVQRLENALANGQRLTGADRNFYMHELKESTIMSRGVPWEKAHPETMQWDKVGPYELYHPEVIQQNPSFFSPRFKEFWEQR